MSRFASPVAKSSSVSSISKAGSWSTVKVDQSRRSVPIGPETWLTRTETPLTPALRPGTPASCPARPSISSPVYLIGVAPPVVTVARVRLDTDAESPIPLVASTVSSAAFSGVPLLFSVPPTPTKTCAPVNVNTSAWAPVRLVPFESLPVTDFFTSEKPAFATTNPNRFNDAFPDADRSAVSSIANAGSCPTVNDDQSSFGCNNPSGPCARLICTSTCETVAERPAIPTRLPASPAICRPVYLTGVCPPVVTVANVSDATDAAKPIPADESTASSAAFSVVHVVVQSPADTDEDLRPRQRERERLSRRSGWCRSSRCRSPTSSRSRSRPSQPRIRTDSTTRSPTPTDPPSRPSRTPAAARWV